MLAVIETDHLNCELRDTNHPGIKFDGVFFYEWKSGFWVPASIATVERYQILKSQREKYRKETA